MAEKEYIEREAAIKRFKFAVLDCLGMEPTIRASDVVKAIESIPAADVRPVVLCKDCIHLGFKDFNGICDGGPVCGVVKPWDYCSHGVRKGADMREREAVPQSGGASAGGEATSCGPT